MRLASFSLADGRPRPGLIVGDEILDLSDPATGLPPTMAGLLALGADGLERAALGAGRRGGPARPGGGAAPCAGAGPAGHPRHRHELPGPRGRDGPRAARVAVLVQQAAHVHRRAGRSHRVAVGVRHGRLRRRAGARHRAALPARAGGAGLRGRRRLHHHQRREHARLAVAHADLHHGEVLRHATRRVGPSW